MITEVTYRSVESWLDGRDILVLLDPDNARARTEILTRLDNANLERFGAGERPLLIAPTSGSTGAAPSLVVLSAQAACFSARATLERLGGAGRWVAALPAHHVAGFQVLLRSVLAGCEPLSQLPGTAFIAPDRDFCREIQREIEAGTRLYTALVPTQLTRILASSGAGLDALKLCAAVLVGGGPTDVQLYQKALDAGVRLTLTYGMTETAGGCVYDGIPLRGTKVRIEDGLIWLSTPSLCEGYVDQDAPIVAEQASATSLRWLVTKDRGEFVDGQTLDPPKAIDNYESRDSHETPDAASLKVQVSPIIRADSKMRLQVLGRADDIIVHGGEKTSAQAVKRILESHPQVAFAHVFGMPDEQWGEKIAAGILAQPAGLAQTEKLEQEKLEQELRDLVAAELGRHSIPQVWFPLPYLPKTALDKVDGAKIRQWVSELAESN